MTRGAARMPGLTNGTRLSPERLEQLRGLVRRLGLHATVRLLRSSEATIESLASGHIATRGTVDRISTALEWEERADAERRAMALIARTGTP